MLTDLEEQPGTKLTYDRGWLEIMTPLVSHENSKKLLGRFVEAATDKSFVSSMSEADSVGIHLTISIRAS